jgi:plastocyanin
MSVKGLAVAIAIGMTACGGGGGGGTTDPPPGNTATTGTVRGSVFDQNGAGVSGASVQLSASGQTSLNTTTGNDGSFTFSNVAVAVWTVSVTPPSGYTGSASTAVTVVAGQLATASNLVVTKTAATTPPSTAQVSMIGSNFSPASVTIAQNGSVTWRNQDADQHNVIGGNFSSPTLNQNATFTQQFPAKGTFDYICTFHSGMRGTVIVQ